MLLRCCPASICGVVGSACSFTPAPATGLSHFLKKPAPFRTPVTPYEYASRAADETILALIDQLTAGEIDVIALTSAPQVRRLFHVAQGHGLTDRLLAGLGRTMIAAIGPVVAEAVRQRGLSPAITPRGAYFMKPLVSAITAAMSARPAEDRPC